MQNYQVKGTQVRTPPSTDGREHKLLIGLPYGYERDPTRAYPVLYLCDGYWDFLLVMGLYGSLWADGLIDEFITVGLAYGCGYPDDPGVASRKVDLTPTAEDKRQGSLTTPSGRYLETIATTFAPFVEREYRIDPSRRAIAGSSLGATFSFLALLRKPGFFSSALLLSPCLSAGNGAAWRLEADHFQAQTGTRRNWFRKPAHLRARLFLALGASDSAAVTTSGRAFNRLLDRRRYVGLEKRFWLAPSTTHSALKAEGFSRGLTYLFARKS